MNYYPNLSAIAPVLRSFSGEGLAKAEQTQWRRGDSGKQKKARPKAALPLFFSY